MLGHVVRKPWGYYNVLVNNSQARMKHMVIRPGGSISLQFHMLRDEFWFVITGFPVIEISHTEYVASPGAFFHIKCGEPHKLINTTQSDITVIEVMIGTSIETDTCYLEQGIDNLTCETGPI